MTRTIRILIAAVAVASMARAGTLAEANDDRSIPEPAYDGSGEYLWWDGARNMTFYQLGRVVDLGESLHAAGRLVGLAPSREALDVNALDEVPDSSWFTNRHHLHRLSPSELERGPNVGPPPAATGPLTVISGKRDGMTPGFVLEDESGRRFVVKFDPPEAPELATAAEIVSSRILHALGWNIPEYHLFDLDPKRLTLAPDAWIHGKYNRRRPLSGADVEGILDRAARLPDGRYRAVASTLLPGIPKGPFRTEGVRPDDPNDVIPHEDRRVLRGLRVVAAWINYADARRGNFYDAFIHRPEDPPGHGYLKHYLIDFSSTLGSGNVEWKDARFGHEYFVDPAVVLKSLFTLGLWVKPWEDPVLAHPAVGYLDVETFEPEEWRTSYPQPLFDRMTERDARWGARLVGSFSDGDIRAVVAAARFSDPEASERLFGILRGRRDRIAATWAGAGETPAGIEIARATESRP